MRQHIFAFACLCSAAAVLVAGVPLPARNQELDVLQIPLGNGKEIDVLTLGAKDQEQLIADRNKRTIGLLRELFPDITKEIDSIVNRIIAQVIRVAGPSLLPTLLGGNNRATTESNGFDASFDDDDENDDDVDIESRFNNDNDLNTNSVSVSTNSNSVGTRVQIDLPTFPPETRNGNTNNSNNDDDSVTESTTSANKVSVRVTTITTTTPPPTTTTTTTTIPPPTTTTTTTTIPPPTTTTTTTTIPPPTTTTTTTIPPPPTTPPTTAPPPPTTPPPSPTTTTTTTTLPPTTTTTTTTPPTTTTTTTTPTTTSTTTTEPPTEDPTFPAAAPATTVEPTTSTVVESTTPATTTTTTSNVFNVVQQPLAASDVDESQLVAIIDNINRLLNSTNYFITTRDNLTTPTSATTTTTTGTSSTPSPTDNTVKITKLLPNGAATDTQIDLSAINKQLEETIRVARQVKEAEAAAQAVSALQQQPLPYLKADEQPIQLSFNNEVSPSLSSSSNNNIKSVSNDLQLTESKSPAIDDLTLDSNEDTADLDDRNKRFLSFGGNAGLAGGASGGSSAGGGAGAGGSGNFLFDIVRLFSGSVQTQGGDDAANSANSVNGSSDSDSDSDANRSADGYTEGIPGPVTRLVVLANRGLANLVQDLILRVAATSEKFVNFKAKLITALI